MNLDARVAFAGGLVAGAVLMYYFAPQPKPAPKMRRNMQITTIKKEKLEQYKKYHAAVWPEVEAGLVKYGIKVLSIWQPSDGGNKLNMYMEWPEDLNLGKALGPGSKYLADPVVEKWETLMCTYFEAGQWEDMKEVYSLTPTSSTNSEAPSYTIVR